MIRRVFLWFFILLLAGCSSLIVSNSVIDRRPLAQSLEKQQKYAEALIQWQILQTAYPDDESIKTQINQLNTLISDRLIALFERLDKAQHRGNEKQIRHTYLKILALQPNNQIAIEELRKFEWQHALSQAVAKTQTIKKYFVETQNKANRSIQLSHILEKGEQFTHDKKYYGLLQLADTFAAAYPEHPKPQEYRLLAYTKLAELSVKKNNIENAVPLFDKAIQIDQGKNKTLISKNDKLKKKLASKYLILGLKSFQKDLDKAIECFTLSLKYQPDNTVANAQLQRATKVRENLNKIKSKY